MRLGELFALAGLDCESRYENIEVSGVVTDSRKAYRGCIFVCIDGYNTSGQQYIEQAINNGAAVILAEQVRDGCVGGAAIIKIDNTRSASARLLCAQYSDPSKDLNIVGVTGTNGKTSVCYMLESIFMEAGIPCATIGTLGCRVCAKASELCRGGLTTPDSAELYPLLAHLRDTGIRWVFMEVSSHALSLHRVDGVRFEYGVFTNLTRDHLDFHHDIQSYFEAKATLFESCDKAVLNVDDVYGRKLAARYPSAIGCSKAAAMLSASNIECSAQGTKYTLSYGCKKYQLNLKTLGSFSVMNSMQAAAVALDAGIDEGAVIGGLSRFGGVLGRMQRVSGGECPFEVIIDFAHTPDALEKLLLSVREMNLCRGRVVALFGCGGERDRGKRKEMALVASRLSDLSVITSDNPRSEDPDAIIKDILRGIDKEKPYVVIPDRRSAIEWALETARQGDIVVLCGKGHEKYQITSQGKQPFDEEQIVLSALKKRNYGNI